MNVIYYKIWRDLWHNKSRTLQVMRVVRQLRSQVNLWIQSWSQYV